AASARRNVERVPEARRHERRRQPLRLADTLEVGTAHALRVEVAADVGEGVLSGTPVVEVDRRDGAALVPAVRRLDLPESNEAIGRRKGQRPEQHTVD